MVFRIETPAGCTQLTASPNVDPDTNPRHCNCSRTCSRTLGSLFGNRRDPFNHRVRHHGGVDYRVATGTPIGAVKAGKVIQVKSSCRVGQLRCGGGWGNHVIVDHGNGVQTVYAHLSSVNVRVGEKVNQSQILAKSGSTGRSTGPHLHLEFRVHGRRVNPLNYLPH